MKNTLPIALTATLSREFLPSSQFEGTPLYDVKVNNQMGIPTKVLTLMIQRKMTRLVDIFESNELFSK